MFKGVKDCGFVRYAYICTALLIKSFKSLDLTMSSWSSIYSRYILNNCFAFCALHLFLKLFSFWCHKISKREFLTMVVSQKSLGLSEKIVKHIFFGFPYKTKKILWDFRTALLRKFSCEWKTWRYLDMLPQPILRVRGQVADNTVKYLNRTGKKN